VMLLVSLVFVNKLDLWYSSDILEPINLEKYYR